MSTVRPLTLDDLRLSDDELGRLFLNICIAAEAEKHGLPAHSIPEGFSNRIIALYREIEAEHAENTTVEKVLRKAAVEDYSTAGRLLKEHVNAGAENMANANLLMQQVQIRLKGPMAGGAKTKKLMQVKKAELDRQILSEIKKLEQADTNPRDIANIVANRLNLRPRPRQTSP